jgi:hypothetical protein
MYLRFGPMIGALELLKVPYVNVVNCTNIEMRCSIILVVW